MTLRPVFAICALVLTATAAWAETAEAEKRLRKAVDEVTAIAESASNSSALAANARPVLVRSINFEAMTRRAVGPGWKQFSADQRKKAVDLFTTLIIRTYARKYTPGERPVVTYRAATEPAPGRVEITTTLLYKGSRYVVLYRLEKDEGWRITDIVGEGVSLVANYRAQLDAQFQKGGPSAVVDSLAQTVANPE